jgi:hypothetical protein
LVTSSSPPRLLSNSGFASVCLINSDRPAGRVELRPKRYRAGKRRRPDRARSVSDGGLLLDPIELHRRILKRRLEHGTRSRADKGARLEIGAHIVSFPPGRVDDAATLADCEELFGLGAGSTNTAHWNRNSWPKSSDAKAAAEFGRHTPSNKTCTHHWSRGLYRLARC